jgi:secreted Zn-dependent insulinase-like peptidase
MYLAEMANLKMAFSFGSNKIELKFGGYNETIKNLIVDFFKELKSFDPHKYQNLFKVKCIDFYK